MYARVKEQLRQATDAGSLAESANCVLHKHSHLHWVSLASPVLLAEYLLPAQQNKCMGTVMLAAGNELQISWRERHVVLHGFSGNIANIGKADFVWIWQIGPDTENALAVLVPLGSEQASMKITMSSLLGMQQATMASVEFKQHLLPLDHLMWLSKKKMEENLLRCWFELSKALLDHSSIVLDTTIRHTLTRKFTGQHLADQQVIKHRLAALHASLELARSYTNITQAAWDNVECDEHRIKRTKRYIYLMAVDLADKCLQLFGGKGFMITTPNAQAFCNSLTYGLFIDEA